jgi:penicillin-insensitive murein DD-endopeptidase
LFRPFKNRWVIGLAVLMTLLYFSLPMIARWIVADPTYLKYAGKDAQVIVNHVQKMFLFPFGKWLPSIFRSIIVFPYFLLIFGLIRFLILRFKRFWKNAGIFILSVLFLLFLFPDALLIFENNKISISSGSVSNGRIKNAKRIDYRGDNFSTYSFAGYLLGRTFVHSLVKKTILETYEECEKICPGVEFTLGETGSQTGGRFLPHRTHRNGLSVDFMSPLLKYGEPHQSNHLLNLWGYRLEFNDKGEKGNVEIDFESMARHLFALEKAAQKNGLLIQKVIFDPVLKPYLLATPTGQKLKHLPFTKNRVIVRHDDHYHVDFGLVN